MATQLVIRELFRLCESKALLTLTFCLCLQVVCVINFNVSFPLCHELAEVQTNPWPTVSAFGNISAMGNRLLVD